MASVSWEGPPGKVSDESKRWLATRTTDEPRTATARCPAWDHWPNSTGQELVRESP